MSDIAIDGQFEEIYLTCPRCYAAGVKLRNGMLWGEFDFPQEFTIGALIAWRDSHEAQYHPTAPRDGDQPGTDTAAEQGLT